MQSSVGFLSTQCRDIKNINGDFNGECAFVLSSKHHFLSVRKIIALQEKHQCSSDQMEARIKLCSSLTCACHIHLMGEPLQDDAAVVRFGCEKNIGILLEDLSLQRDTCFQKKRTPAMFSSLVASAYGLPETKHILLMQKPLAKHDPKTIVQASIFSEKGGWEHSILRSEIHSLNRL